MLGNVKELEKGLIYATDWFGPWFRIKAVKRGKVATIVTHADGERVQLDNNLAVRFAKPGVDPEPANAPEGYVRPDARKLTVEPRGKKKDKKKS